MPDPNSSSPFTWDGDLGVSDEERAKAESDLQEQCSRMRRLFKENPEGAELLAEWRAASVDAMRGPSAKDAYTLGYMDGQGDKVRVIERMIRMAEEGVDR